MTAQGWAQGCLSSRAPLLEYTLSNLFVQEFTSPLLPPCVSYQEPTFSQQHARKYPVCFKIYSCPTNVSIASTLADLSRNRLFVNSTLASIPNASKYTHTNLLFIHAPCPIKSRRQVSLLAQLLPKRYSIIP